jgi:hypothetical protein
MFRYIIDSLTFCALLSSIEDKTQSPLGVQLQGIAEKLPSADSWKGFFFFAILWLKIT